MNRIRRMFSSVRGGMGFVDQSSQSFYTNTVNQQNTVGGPHYSESKRDYEQVRANSDRYGLY